MPDIFAHPLGADGIKEISRGNSEGKQVINLLTTRNGGRVCLFSQNESTILVMQNPLFEDLVLRTSIFLSVVSCWLSPLSFTRVSSDNSGGQLYPLVLVSSVAFSVAKDFFTRLDY